MKWKKFLYYDKMTWMTSTDIPLENSFRHLLKSRIRLFFIRRNQPTQEEIDENENEIELKERNKTLLIDSDLDVSNLSHRDIELEINYLTSDIHLEECILQPISSQPSKYERLYIWYKVLDSYPDAKYIHETVSLPTVVYTSEPTNRVLMKIIQLILLAMLGIYIFYYPSTPMYIVGSIFVLAWIAIFFI